MILLTGWVPKHINWTKEVSLVEMFCGRGNLSDVHARATGTECIKLGLEHGQDFERVRDRRLMLLLLEYVKPKDLWIAFPCKAWGPWSRFNMSRGPEAKQSVMSAAPDRSEAPFCCK